MVLSNKPRGKRKTIQTLSGSTVSKSYYQRGALPSNQLEAQRASLFGKKILQTKRAVSEEKEKPEKAYYDAALLSQIWRLFQNMRGASKFFVRAK